MTDLKTDGDCFVVAAQIMMENSLSNAPEKLILCHGVVSGQGPATGIDFCHAWVEEDKEVEFPDGHKMRFRVAIDRSNGKDTVLPADFYRRLGRVKLVKEYGQVEAFKMLCKTSHYGPWHSCFEPYL